MSCETGTRKVSLGGLRSGVSRLAGKAAYVAGVMAAGAAGAAAGTLIAPGVGTVGGGLLTGWMMRKHLRERQQRKITEAQENAWGNSQAGQRALKQRDAALARLEQSRQARQTKLSAEAEKIESRYEQARQKWLVQQAKNPDFEKQVKKAALASTALGVAGRMGQHYLNARRWGVSSKTAGVLAAGKAIGNVSWQEQREQAIDELWKKSAAGQRASLRYTAEMSRVKLQRKRINNEFEQKSRAVWQQYKQARTNFMRKAFPGGSGQ